MVKNPESSSGFKESTSLYFHEKVALYKELHFSFSDIKEQVTIGFWSRNLSIFLISRVHNDVDDVSRY